MKSVITGSYKAIVGTVAGSGVGAGGETNSFGSTTLRLIYMRSRRFFLTEEWRKEAISKFKHMLGSQIRVS
jgi:hypothetical protein